MQLVVDIGLEIHAQVVSKCKLFSQSPSSYESLGPNTNINPFDLANPGKMPKINTYCMAQGAKAAIALNCTVQKEMYFDRKHYFYPDLPFGFQITQFNLPVGTNGHVEYECKDGSMKSARIRELHLEQDAGRSIHDLSEKYSFLDFNRAGSPLVEIVTEPDFNSAEEVISFLVELRLILMHAGISTACFEEGAMRCDVSVSARKTKDDPYGKRCEIKNLNSLSAIKLAIEYESNLHWQRIINNDPMEREYTKMLDPSLKRTVIMRNKESTRDYSYIVEYDVPKVVITDKFITTVKKDLMTTVKEKRDMLNSVNLDRSTVSTILGDIAAWDFFMAMIKLGADKKASANWIANEIIGRMNKLNITWQNLKVTPEHIFEITRAISDSRITGKMAKDILDQCFESGNCPSVLIKQISMSKIDDEGEISKIIHEVMEENKDIVDKIIGTGQTRSIEFLIGMTMKKTGGKVSPGIARSKILEILATMKK